MLLYMVAMLACTVAALGAYMAYSLRSIAQKLARLSEDAASPSFNRYLCMSDAPRPVSRAPCCHAGGARVSTRARSVFLYPIRALTWTACARHSIHSSDRFRGPAFRERHTSRTSLQPSRVSSPKVSDAVRVLFVS